MKSRWLATGLAIVAVGALGTGAVAGGALVDKDQSAVRTTVRDAIADVYGAGAFDTTGWTGGHLDSSKVDRIKSGLDARLRLHMTGAALTHYRDILGEAVDRESDGKHAITVAGGVSDIKFNNVAVQADTAVATGRAKVWSQFLVLGADFKGPNAGRPDGYERFAATLTRTADGWRVQTLDMTRVIIDDNGNEIEGG